MKIAILTSGVLPIPAVQGGAVENLLDAALAYNDSHHLHDITVVSAYHPAVQQHPALSSAVNHYLYVNRQSRWHRFMAKVYSKLYHDSYYHYQLEYFLEQAYRRIRGQHFDIILLENRPGFAIKLRRRTKARILSHIHTDLVNLDTPQVESIIASTDAFLCVSDYIRQRIAQVSKEAPSVVVYNGLDAQAFCAAAESTITRQSLGFSDDDFVVIYTGRIVPKKGVKELVQAIQLLSDDPQVKLLVVGGDNYADSVSSNPYLDELHEMGRQMQGRVCFTGFVPYAQLPAYLRLAQVAVVPSRINEALGMSSIEATAMGLPVIATNDGGIPETLVGQKHILIDKDGDLPTQIADGIRRIRSHYSDFTGNRLAPRFSQKAYAQSFFEAIKQYGIK